MLLCVFGQSNNCHLLGMQSKREHVTASYDKKPKEKPHLAFF
jgi:hypothetical protein